jgi:hypothetical protein
MQDSGTKRWKIERNLSEVRRRIAAACTRAGRTTAEVNLIAVTKTVGLEEIGILTDMGVLKMAESRVQEAAEKIPRAPDGIEWHMIGNLQRNKAAKALQLFDTLDAVDGERLALEIDKHAAKKNVVVPVLLEANTSGEDAKHGVPLEGLRALAEKALVLPHVRVEGLMTMTPLTGNAADWRRCFAALRQAAERLRDLESERFSMRRLSMGMTQDFEIAVEEGATEVRIGSALFLGI